MREDVTVTVRDAARLDLEAQPASVGQARRFVRGLLQEWDLDGLVDTASLLVSELATNAVLHARTPYALRVLRDDEQVRVDVLDGSLVQPRRRLNSATAATGRGVALVEELASAWGATAADELEGFAKGVWFTLPVTGVVEDAWAGDWLEGLEA